MAAAILLAAVVLRAWLSWPAMCSPSEDVVACRREWLAALGPTIGVLLSAALIMRQIRVSRTQFFPPALDYLDRANGFLGRVQGSLIEMRVFADHLAGRPAVITSEGDIASVEDQVALEWMKAAVPLKDAGGLLADIARCHLPDFLHNQCVDVARDWSTCRYLVETAALCHETLGKSNLGDAFRDELRRERSQALEDLQRMIPQLQSKAERARIALSPVYHANQMRLVRVAEEISAEIDRR